jgi:hypothetical protein
MDGQASGCPQDHSHIKVCALPSVDEMLDLVMRMMMGLMIMAKANCRGRAPTCAVHPVDDSVDSGTRMIMGLMYWRSSADDNIYAHPLPWVPILDATTRKVPVLTPVPLHIGQAGDAITKGHLAGPSSPLH